MPKQKEYFYEESTKTSVSVSDHPNRKYLYIAVIVIFLVNFCVLFWVRRRMKRTVTAEVNARVETAVHQYFALSDGQNSQV
jgi:hypothetical protein